MPAETSNNQPVTREEILSIIQAQLGEILEKDGSSIGLDDTFEALDADSLALIELVEALEDELSERAPGFHIDDEDLDSTLAHDDSMAGAGPRQVMLLRQGHRRCRQW
jgi:acyl carrier protein